MMKNENEKVKNVRKVWSFEVKIGQKRGQNDFISNNRFSPFLFSP